MTTEKKPSSKFQIGDRVCIRLTKETVIDRKAMMESTCRVCHNPGKSHCARCYLVRYCSRECQTKDWKDHKHVCKQARDSKKVWNGLHGAVVAVADEEGMITVDLDLLPTEQASHVSVGEESLVREGKRIKNVFERAETKGGSLVEIEGMTAQLTLNLARYIAAVAVLGMTKEFPSMREVALLPTMGPPGFVLQNRITSTTWSTWSFARGTNYDGTEQQATKDIVRKYVLEEVLPDMPNWKKDKIFSRMRKALDCPGAMAGWNCRVHGNFWVVGMDKDGSYLVPDENRGMVYQCLGIKDPIWPKVEHQFQGSPIMLNVTMIPWYGRLIYDGVMVPPYGRPQPKKASPSLAKKLKATVAKAQNEKRVIQRLMQLEVEGGSKKGLDDGLGKSCSTTAKKGSTSTTTAEQPPATQQEKKILAQLFKIRATPDPLASSRKKEGEYPNMDNLPDHSSWIFRRQGYTEMENPTHMGVVLATPSKLIGPFQCTKLVPSSTDILQGVVKLSRQVGKRPIFIGIDDKTCEERVDFLLKTSSGSGGTHTLFYAPPSREETAAAMVGGAMMGGRGLSSF